MTLKVPKTLLEQLYISFKMSPGCPGSRFKLRTHRGQALPYELNRRASLDWPMVPRKKQANTNGVHMSEAGTRSHRVGCFPVLEDKGGGFAGVNVFLHLSLVHTPTQQLQIELFLSPLFLGPKDSLKEYVLVIKGWIWGRKGDTANK